MPPQLNRLIYVDDSGNPNTGLAVFGWIEFSPDHWSAVLTQWLETRKRLWRDFGINVTEELHTTLYVNGRGRISKRVPDRHIHNGQTHWKDLGREVALECLETLRSTEGLRIGAVYRRGEPHDIGKLKQLAYASLVDRVESELADSESLAMIFIDGDGSDTSYRTTHRTLKLNQRRVIEDALHLDSRTSQLVQMADLVAWSANSAIDKHPKNEFARSWYADYLSERDPHRAPREI
ncbi:MAG: DUF3800 domain-containing protein [Micrococcaceae bacterium]